MLRLDYAKWGSIADQVRDDVEIRNIHQVQTIIIGIWYKTEFEWESKMHNELYCQEIVQLYI